MVNRQTTESMAVCVKLLKSFSTEYAHHSIFYGEVSIEPHFCAIPALYFFLRINFQGAKKHVVRNGISAGCKRCIVQNESLSNVSPLVLVC
jgi:hypothetical protein